MHNETGNANSFFWNLLKMSDLKIRLWNQHLILDRLAKETQALICIGNMIKDLFELFLFSKKWKYSSTITRKENYLRWQYIEDREIWVKPVSLTARPWDLAGLYPGKGTKSLSNSNLKNCLDKQCLSWRFWWATNV